jgi:hypothetical protein
VLVEKIGYKYRSKLIKDKEDFKGFYYLLTFLRASRVGVVRRAEGRG